MDSRSSMRKEEGGSAPTIDESGPMNDKLRGLAGDRKRSSNSVNSTALFLLGDGRKVNDSAIEM
eukprot:scaffold2641_cov236-Chaetoceros_neogracile.AAC.1